MLSRCIVGTTAAEIPFDRLRANLAHLGILGAASDERTNGPHP